MWEVERNAFKPFPCGIVCHPAIDASIQIHREMKHQNVSVNDIGDVKMQVHPLVIEVRLSEQLAIGTAVDVVVFGKSAHVKAEA